jgi:hypothetical protein
LGGKEAWKLEGLERNKLRLASIARKGVWK